MTEHQEEQAALHAFHMLDEHEIRILESDMRTDGRLRECVIELQESASNIAYLLPEQSPPVECRRALLIALKQRRRSNIVALSVPLRIFRNPWLAWAAAAMLALAAVGLWETNKNLTTKIAALSKSENEARAEVANAKDLSESTGIKLAQASSELDRVKNEFGSEIVRLKEESKVAHLEAVAMKSAIKKYDEGVAIVIWDYEKQEGKLKLDKMLPVPPNKDYQLWVLDKKKPGVPVSAGVIKVDQHGFATVTFKPTEGISEMSKFALSVEKVGGVPQKSQDGPIVFSGP